MITIGSDNIKIKIDEKLHNWNETINFNRRNRFMAANEKKKEMKKIGEYLKDTSPIKKYPISLKCYWHIKNVLSDLDNKSLKSVLDKMQEMEILENDNVKHIQNIEYFYIKDDKDFLEIEVLENETL